MGDNTRNSRHACQIGLLRCQALSLNVIRTVVASELVLPNTHLYLITEVFVNMLVINWFILLLIYHHNNTNREAVKRETECMQSYSRMYDQSFSSLVVLHISFESILAYPCESPMMFITLSEII